MVRGTDFSFGRPIFEQKTYLDGKRVSAVIVGFIRENYSLAVVTASIFNQQDLQDVISFNSSNRRDSAPEPSYEELDLYFIDED